MRLIALLIPLVLSAAALRAEPAAPMPATITVTGEGNVERAPDLATVFLGVVSEERTATAALAQNSQRLGAVMRSLTESGIEARDIQTSGLSLGPRYRYDDKGGPPVVTGYVASNTVSARLRDLDKVGTLLDRVVADGANTLNGLTFGLQDDSAARDEARRRAVADARGKAQLYVKAAGARLGRILSISEADGPSGPQPKMMMEMAAADRAGGVPVASGEISLSSRVTIVWEIDQ
ncbi:SIMPL domain-containing protein [Albidovulum sp.]